MAPQICIAHFGDDTEFTLVPYSQADSADVSLVCTSLLLGEPQMEVMLGDSLHVLYALQPYGNSCTVYLCSQLPASTRSTHLEHDVQDGVDQLHTREKQQQHKAAGPSKHTSTSISESQ
jgi:hypothetical protein